MLTDRVRRACKAINRRPGRGGCGRLRGGSLENRPGSALGGDSLSLGVLRRPRLSAAMGSTFSARVAADLIRYAASKGADGEALAAMLRLPPGRLGREDTRIPCSTMAALWKRAMDDTGDPDIAFNMASEHMFKANRTTQLIMESSKTVREAFQLAAQYSVLIADAMAVEVGETESTIYIEFVPRPDWIVQPPEVVRDCLNITCVSAVLALRQLIGRDSPPSLLTFSFSAPTNVARYYRVFDCSIEFEAVSNRIGFPLEVASAAIELEDRGLMAALRQYADGLKDNFDPRESFSQSVKTRILDLMDPFPPTLTRVARDLGSSERSAQRRLGEEGVTFKGLVEDTRMELAERYLTTSHRSVDEVAYLSGYADTSSFVRAFKRRYGVPPRRFAKERVSERCD